MIVDKGKFPNFNKTTPIYVCQNIWNDKLNVAIDTPWVFLSFEENDRRDLFIYWWYKYKCDVN